MIFSLASFVTLKTSLLNFSFSPSAFKSLILPFLSTTNVIVDLTKLLVSPKIAELKFLATIFLNSLTPPGYSAGTRSAALPSTAVEISCKDFSSTLFTMFASTFF